MVLEFNIIILSIFHWIFDMMVSFSNAHTSRYLQNCFVFF